MEGGLQTWKRRNEVPQWGCVRRRIQRQHDAWKRTFQYAAGDVFKSIGEWKEGKKFGLFEDIVRVSKQVYYDNDELKESSNVKVRREAALDEDTDTNDIPSKKRRHVCVSPP